MGRVRNGAQGPAQLWIAYRHANPPFATQDRNSQSAWNADDVEHIAEPIDLCQCEPVFICDWRNERGSQQQWQRWKNVSIIEVKTHPWDLQLVAIGPNHEEVKPAPMFIKTL